MKRRLTDHSGYLIIDHRDSPGISISEVPDRIRLNTPIVGKGEVFERDIQFCAHCGCQVIINPMRERPRGYCSKCNHYVCDNPICNKECIPLAKVLDGNATLIGG